MNTNTVHYKVTTDSYFRFFMVLGAVVAGWYLKDMLIALLVAVLIASSISPLATKMQKFKIPRAVTVLSVLLSLMGIFIGIIALFIPLIYGEISNFFANISEFQNRIIQSISAYTGDPNFLSNTFGSVSVGDFANNIKSILTGVSGGLGSTASVLATFVFQLIIILVISFYLAVQERGVEKFLRIVTPLKHEDYIIDLWGRAQSKIVSWVKGQMILAVLIGLIVYVGLTFIGVPHAFLFALLAAVCETIPIVGMTIATIPAVLVAFVTGGTPLLITAGIFYIIVGQLENHVFSPMVVSNIVGLPSVIVVISLLIGGTLLGFWGVLISVPVAAAIMEYVNDVEHSKNKKRTERLL